MQPTARLPNRRSILGGLAAGTLAAPAFAASTPRIASLDYGLTQTLLALGYLPIAVAEAADWAKWTVEPSLPPSVRDLGTTREVNLEILQALKPDLILSTPYLDRLTPLLTRIAPVASFPIHATGASPWPSLVTATRDLGVRLGIPGEAEALIVRTEAELAALGRRAARWRDRSIVPMIFQDARNVWVFGDNSLYDDALQRMGLTNGWTGRTNAWGFAAVGMEALAAAREARLVCFDPVPSDALRLLAESPIWRATGFADPDRVVRLPPVLAFGALPSMTRFARLLAEAAERA